jgi:hypothetical protein
MDKTHTLEATLSFTIRAFPGRVFNLETDKMSNYAVERGLVVAARQIVGDAIGGKKSPEKKLAIAYRKIARLQTGTLGEGTFGAKITRLEKALRTILITKLENEGMKTAKATKLVAQQPVEMVYRGFYEKDGLSLEEANKKWNAVVERGRMMVKIASDDGNIDPDEEVDDDANDESEDADESEEAPESNTESAA